MTETILVPLHPFNASFFKDNLGKPVPERCETSVDLNEAEMMGFLGQQWHPLDNVQTICISLSRQITTPQFLQAGCSS